MFRLHLTHPTGRTETRVFPTAFARALDLVILSSQPVILRLDEPPVTDTERLIEDAQRIR